MFYHQKVARVQVFADIQNFALRAHCVHGIPFVQLNILNRAALEWALLLQVRLQPWLPPWLRDG